MNESNKYDLLEKWLEKKGKIAIAFSGGVDSTFLLAAAKKVLHQNVLALTVKTPYIPGWEADEALAFCKSERINHRFVPADIIPEIISNPVNRCYLCKKNIFTLLASEAAQLGFEHLADGTNADDSVVLRPGMKALQELGILSPLHELGITKKEIRKHSAKMGLPTADKPSYACLLTRLPYNYPVKIEELVRVEKAERFMASLGYPNSRVRNHSDLARIEVERQYIGEFVQKAEASGVMAYFHELGYRHITIDLEGYRSGSFDN